MKVNFFRSVKIIQPVSSSSIRGIRNHLASQNSVTSANKTYCYNDNNTIRNRLLIILKKRVYIQLYFDSYNFL